MKCYYCGTELNATDVCGHCGADVGVWKQVASISNRLFNDGLEQAKSHTLSSAIDTLKMSLRYNKNNMDARNLLGLIYYQMGETVDAISEWVISKSLVPDNNPATEYLYEVQKSSNKLDQMNQTIKKFNQALEYCDQGSHDLAVIQLKKVLTMNPNVLKAHQLLALLYMREDNYELAMRALRQANRIDSNNPNTIRYMQECKEKLRVVNNKSKKFKKEEPITYQSGNDVIIRPSRFTDNTAVSTVINLLIGAAIGIAVMCFLVVPGIKKSANNDASNQIVEANENAATKATTIEEMQTQIDTLTSDKEALEEDAATNDEKLTSYEQLLTAYCSYIDQDFEGAATSLEAVNPDLLSADATDVYNKMFDQIAAATLGVTENEAMVGYMAGDYNTAVSKLLSIMKVDESYDGGNAAYYLAFAYFYQSKNEEALRWFKVAQKYVTDPTVQSVCTQTISDLETMGYVAASGDLDDEDQAQDDKADDNKKNDDQKIETEQ